MTRFISAAEANRRFSEILGQAAEGERVIITRRGDPVAQLVAFDRCSDEDSRALAWARLLSTVEGGLPLGGGRVDRDSLHER
jgi:prevent-host-death family protein